MKKSLYSLFFIIKILFGFSVFAEENDLKNSLIFLPEVNLAAFVAEKNFSAIENLRFFYLPEISFSLQSAANGTFSDLFGNESKNLFSESKEFEASSMTAKMNLIQKIMGGGSAGFSVAVPLFYSNYSEKFSWKIEPSVNFSIPVSSSNEIVKKLCANNLGKYNRKAQLILNQKNLSERQAIKKFFENANDFIYCSALEEIYLKKQQKLEFQVEEYEKLFVLGRITSFELTQIKNQLEEFYQLQMENSSKKIQSKCELCVYGDFFLKENIDIFEFNKNSEFNFIDIYRNFVDEWESYSFVCLKEEDCQKKINQLENIDSFATEIENFVSLLPKLNVSMAVSSNSMIAGESSGISDVNWNASIYMDFPVFNGNGFFKIKKDYEKAKKIFNQKEQLIRKDAETTLEERKIVLEQYECYSLLMEKTFSLEKTRFQNYLALNQAGRISDFDLQMQSINVFLAELKSLNARSKCVSLKLSFY